MGIWKWILGLGAAGAVTEYGIARYFFNRTVLRGNAKRERTTKMAGTSWDAYIPNIRSCREWVMAGENEEVSILSGDGLKLVGSYFPADRGRAGGGSESRAVAGAAPESQTVAGGGSESQAVAGAAPESQTVAGTEAGRPVRTVLCFHGYTSEGINDFPCLAKFYLEQGYNVLLVDERAHGRSEGTYIGFGCLDRYDVLSWLEYLIGRFGPEQEFILHGMSMGGATVLMSSGLPLPTQVKGIVSDCGFTSAWDVFTSVLHNMYHMPAFPIMQIADRMAKAEAGYGLAECNAVREVAKAQVPILFIHGDADTFVPCRMCHELYEACASQKSILIVKGASHAEAYHKDIEAYEGALREFLSGIEKKED